MGAVCFFYGTRMSKMRIFQRWLFHFPKDGPLSKKRKKNVRVLKSAHCPQVHEQIEGRVASRGCHIKHLWNNESPQQALAFHSREGRNGARMLLSKDGVSSGRTALKAGTSSRLGFSRDVENLGVAFPLGICPKFTPAPHFPASVGA